MSRLRRAKSSSGQIPREETRDSSKFSGTRVESPNDPSKSALRAISLSLSLSSIHLSPCVVGRQDGFVRRPNDDDDDKEAGESSSIHKEIKPATELRSIQSKTSVLLSFSSLILSFFISFFCRRRTLRAIN